MTHLIKFQYYSLILDTIDTKLSKPEQTKQEKTKQKKKRKEKKTKHTCTIKFDNKALELIQLPQIFNLPEAGFQLPDNSKNNGNNFTVTYQLGKTIRNKISI